MSCCGLDAVCHAAYAIGGAFSVVLVFGDFHGLVSGVDDLLGDR